MEPMVLPVSETVPNAGLFSSLQIAVEKGIMCSALTQCTTAQKQIIIILQICSNYFCDTFKKLYIHTYIYAMCLQYGINFALYSFLMILTKNQNHNSHAFFQHNNTAIVHIHTLTCGWGITPVCSVHGQLLTGSGLSSHQVVARVAHVGGSGADGPSSQCDCAECWVVQLATDCCRERHHVQCTYSMHYSSETNHYQICFNYFCDTFKKLYIHICHVSPIWYLLYIHS